MGKFSIFVNVLNVRHHFRGTIHGLLDGDVPAPLIRPNQLLPPLIWAHDKGRYNWYSLSLLSASHKTLSCVSLIAIHSMSELAASRQPTKAKHSRCISAQSASNENRFQANYS